jgi:hypothetical protein
MSFLPRRTLGLSSLSCPPQTLDVLDTLFGTEYNTVDRDVGRCMAFLSKVQEMEDRVEKNALFLEDRVQYTRELEEWVGQLKAWIRVLEPESPEVGPVESCLGLGSEKLMLSRVDRRQRPPFLYSLFLLSSTSLASTASLTPSRFR